MPKSIAIIGASREPRKFSHKAVKAYQSLGYKVFPVNPNSAEIAGLKTYDKLASLPEKVQEISIYLPPAKTFSFLDELNGYPLKIVYFNPGSADNKVLDKAKRMNLPAVAACSIVAKGLDPADF